MKGHIRKRGADSYSLVIDIGKDNDGKRRQKWITFHGGKRAAQQELACILTELNSDKFVEPSQQTIDKYLLDWLSVIESKLSLKTFSRYQEIVKLHLIPAFGKIHLQKLNGLHVEAYYAKARVSGRVDGKGGLSEQTLLHHHRALSLAMKRAEKLKLRQGNPCTDIDAPKPVKQEVSVLNEQQTIQLLNEAKNTRLYMPMLVTVTTGLRLGELLALRWADIDFDAAELCINRTLQRIKGHGLILKDSPKTETSRRRVALPVSVLDELRKHSIEQEKTKRLLGSMWSDNGLVFPCEDGAFWGPDALSHQFSSFVKKHGFKLTFHGLRHTHATHLLRANVSPKIASDRLGHSCIKITMDLYSHVLKDSQHEAASRIDAVFSNAVTGSQN
jgi:integrase